ncbi:MAG TPA: TolC family protein [Pirellulales bacterium]|nr:TolC family protein [Pirellulales bacterium]
MAPSSRRAPRPQVGNRSPVNLPTTVPTVSQRRKESWVDRSFPINLPTALRLANAQAIDVRIASEKIRLATAQLQQARALWLPTILVGPNYFRHDGPIQDIQGNIINTSKSAFLMGAGPILVFSTLELFRTQDHVAAEVVQAHAQVEASAGRLQAAEREVKGAVESALENLKGFSQTRKVGELPVLITRPQEVVAAIQALALAYNDYYGAVADFNRAQFRLYRAIGNAPAAVESLLPSPPEPSGGRGGKRGYLNRREPVPSRNELPPPR